MVLQKEIHYGRIDFSINSKFYNNPQATVPQDKLQFQKKQSMAAKTRLIWVVG